MARVRQLREIILIRRKSEWNDHLTLEEVVTKTLASAIHAAAGNAKGAKAAQGIRFTEPDPSEPRRLRMITSATASMMFKPDALLPPFSDEEIAAEIQRQEQERKKG